MYHYYDKQTRQFEADVRIHNFSKDMPGLVRIIGSSNLNPEDKHYPDKKWVKISDVFSEVQWTSTFVEKHTL
jgi:aspartate/tyrosine/aromatic aminotransferase